MIIFESELIIIKSIALFKKHIEPILDHLLMFDSKDIGL